jgi:hypothetical protein
MFYLEENFHERAEKIGEKSEAEPDKGREGDM